MSFRAITLLIGVCFTFQSAWGTHGGDRSFGERASVRVLGGTPSNIKQVVQIARKDSASYHCSATVVGSREIVTAAHCVETGKPYKVNVGTEADPIWQEIECRAHTKYPRPSPEKFLESDRTKAAGMKACEDFKSGKISRPQLNAFKTEHFKAKSAAGSLSDDEAAADVAACRLVTGTFTTIPPATMKPLSQVRRDQYQHVGFGCTGFGTRSPIYPATRQGGRANVNVGQPDNAAYIKTTFLAGSSDSVGVCFGDSGGFLGAKDGENVYITGVHSTTGAANYDLDEELCIFKYSLRASGGGTSVNLFSSTADELFKELEAKGWRFAGRTTSGSDPLPPPGLDPAPLPLPDGVTPPPTGKPAEPYLRIGNWLGGTNEYFPSNPSNPLEGTLVVRDSSGAVRDYFSYSGDPRTRTSIRRLAGPPPGFVDGRPTPGTAPIDSAPLPPTDKPVPPVADSDYVRRWQAAGQPVSGGLPVIQIGRSHPPLEAGQVYLIDGRRWRFLGGGRFAPG